MKKRPIIFILIPYILIIFFIDALNLNLFFSSHYSKNLENGMEYKLRIVSDKSIKNKTISYKVKITHILRSDNWQPVKGRLIIYFNKSDSASYSLSYGEEIITNTILNEIENTNISSFDYKKYMKRQRIYHNVFIKPGNWIKTSENTGSKIIAGAKKIKLRLENKILESHLGKEEAGLAIAMLLGDKKFVDKDIRNSFNATGLAHILCVSGLHIGIIMLFVDFLLKLITFGNYKLFIPRKLIAVIIGFSVAFIVGLSPSSLRVATMISILFLTKYFSRGYDSLNTLLLTGFIFLVFDPLILFNWSFQLSFLAILGISAFSKTKYRFNSLFPFYLRPITSNFGMTLSAQFFVLPILIFRFKSLPIYILFGNLLIVPMLSIVLVFILLMLIAGNTGLFSEIITPILNTLLSLMINIVEFINSLPYSSIKL